MTDVDAGSESTPTPETTPGEAPASGRAEVVIPTPDDWHVHLRDDEMLATVAPLTAGRFRFALVMPNLVPPVLTTEAAAAYRTRILDAVGDDAIEGFTPLLTLYLNDELSIDDLEAGVDGGVVHAVKYYPAGATTNSDAGGTSLPSFRPVLERLVERRVPLLVHAESTDPGIDLFDRERAFLDRELAPVVDELPELRVTVEHLSTRAGVEFVESHPSVRGTITPHHLSCDRTDLLANGLRPDLYCKPVLNTTDDREALVAAATSGSTQFFLGTDSAPHPTSQKYSEVARPGIFNAPFALEVVAEVFYQADALDRLERFTSVNGALHYGFEVASRQVRLVRAARTEPTSDRVVTASGDEVRIFGLAEAALWQVRR
jgi:dihydroorotase